jgi:hypothetical protein
LAKKELRLQFSGFAVFAAKLVSVATGFAFQFMLARAIGGSSESNIWFNITDVVTYFTLLGGVVPFWVMRYIARGKEGAAKTGIATNFIIALIFAVAYLAMAPLILSTLGITANYLVLYLVASVQIVELYMLNVLESCLQAVAPHVVGYGLVLQQVIKLGLGYVLISLLNTPLLGAVVSVLVSFGVQAFYYYALLHQGPAEKIDWGYIKDWIKSSPATIYNVLGTQLLSFVLLLLYNFGSNSNPDLIGARGYYGYAAQIAQIVAYSSFLSFALYPKLMAERKGEHITSSMKMVLMFAIPMTVGAVALSDSYMGLLNPDLRAASGVLVILAVDALVSAVSGLYSSVLFGVETVDQKGVSFRKLVKSKLFVVFSMPYLQAAIALPLAYYVLTSFAFHAPLEAALYVSVIYLAVHLIAFVWQFAIVRKIIAIQTPWKAISKYIAASAVMGAVMFLVPHPDRISTTLAMTAVGGGIYLVLLAAIDKEARKLPKTALREIKARTFGRKAEPKACD